MENDIRTIQVGFTDTSIFIKDEKGACESHPLVWFPRLFKATDEQRKNFTISPFGIHWESLDEDLSFEGFFTYNKTIKTLKPQ